MFESADARDLRRFMFSSTPRSAAPCAHCGSTDPNPVDYLWPCGVNHHFGCCPELLVERHGADRGRIVKQNAPSFIAD